MQKCQSYIILLSVSLISIYHTVLSYPCSVRLLTNNISKYTANGGNVMWCTPNERNMHIIYLSCHRCNQWHENKMSMREIKSVTYHIILWKCSVMKLYQLTSLGNGILVFDLLQNLPLSLLSPETDKSTLNTSGKSPLWCLVGYDSQHTSKLNSCHQATSYWQTHRPSGMVHHVNQQPVTMEEIQWSFSQKSTFVVYTIILIYFFILHGIPCLYNILLNARNAVLPT